MSALSSSSSLGPHPSGIVERMLAERYQLLSIISSYSIKNIPNQQNKTKQKQKCLHFRSMNTSFYDNLCYFTTWSKYIAHLNLIKKSHLRESSSC